MCGIYGIAFQEGHKINEPGVVRLVLQNIMLESENRGFDATGVSFVSEKEISVLKDNVRARMFTNSKAFLSACSKYISLSKDKSQIGRTLSIIGHCRLETKGTHEVRHNNHPIITDNVVGVHNGMISNDDHLFHKFQKEYTSFRRDGRVDSEVIFRLIDHFVHTKRMNVSKAIAKTTKLIRGSYACSFVDRSNPYMLWLFRAISPTEIFNYEDCGIIAFASSGSYVRKAIRESLEDSLFGKPTVIHYPEDSCIGINLFDRSIYRFRLGKDDSQEDDLQKFYTRHYCM